VLESAAQSGNQVKGRVLLVVVTKTAPILDLLSGEDQVLLVRFNNPYPGFWLDVVDGVVERDYVRVLHLDLGYDFGNSVDSGNLAGPV